MKYTCLLFVLTCICLFSCNKDKTEPDNATWHKTYFGKLTAAAQCSDGNVIITTEDYSNLNYITKISAQTGDTIWSFEVLLNLAHITGITEAGENSFVIAYTRDEAKTLGVAQINKTGYWDWTNEFGGLTNRHNGKIIRSGDGNLLIASYSNHNSNLGHDLVLTKLNDTGKQLWVYEYPNNGRDQPSDLVELADNSIIVCGETYSPTTNRKMLVLKVNANGEKQWLTNFGENDAAALCIAESPGGNVIIGGSQKVDIYSRTGVLAQLTGAGQLQGMSLIDSARKKLDLGDILHDGAVGLVMTGHSYTIGTPVSSDVFSWVPGDTAKISPNEGRQYGEYIFRTPTGNYLVLGNTDTPHNSYFVLGIKRK